MPALKVGSSLRWSSVANYSEAWHARVVADTEDHYKVPDGRVNHQQAALQEEAKLRILAKVTILYYSLVLLGWFGAV